MTATLNDHIEESVAMFKKEFEVQFNCGNMHHWDCGENEFNKFLRTALLSVANQTAEALEVEKKRHMKFECSSAHNGKGCFEDFCEDQNCRDVDAVEIRGHNSAIDEMITKRDNFFKV